jgi:hypothetical protein
VPGAPPGGILAGVTGSDVVDLNRVGPVLGGQSLGADVVLRCRSDEGEVTFAVAIAARF